MLNTHSMQNRPPSHAYVVTLFAEEGPNHSLDRLAVPSGGVSVVVADRGELLAAVPGVKPAVVFGVSRDAVPSVVLIIFACRV